MQHGSNLDGFNGGYPKNGWFMFISWKIKKGLVRGTPPILGHLQMVIFRESIVYTRKIWASCKCSFHPMEEPRILLSNMVMLIDPGLLRGQRTTPKVVIDSFSTSSSIAMFTSKWSTRECENKRKPNHPPHSPLSILKNCIYIYIYINP